MKPECWPLTSMSAVARASPWNTHAHACPAGSKESVPYVGAGHGYQIEWSGGIDGLSPGSVVASTREPKTVPLGPAMTSAAAYASFAGGAAEASDGSASTATTAASTANQPLISSPF